MTADITVYAQWTPIATTYTVTFDSNGGAPTPAPITGVAFNATVTLPAAPTLAGNTFAGWNTALNGSGTAFDGTTLVTADITVYAQWTVKQYTLTYTAGAKGSITGITPQTVNYGANGTAVTAVAAAGYHFVNWSDASVQNPRTDTNVTANITVTANFAANSSGGGGNVCQPIISDINRDGVVNKYDFAIMMANWGTIGSDRADLNGDWIVNKYDFAVLVANWSKTGPLCF